MPESVRRVTLTLTVPEPEIGQGPDGDTLVTIEGFGSDTTPGAPKLPAVCCTVELPQNASVRGFEIEHLESTRMAGRFRVPAARPLVHDEPVPEAESIRARALARQTWSRRRDEIFSSDRLYPQDLVTVGDSRSTRTCTLLPIQVRPVQYHPATGTLVWTSSIHAIITYLLPAEAAQSIADVDLRTEVAGRINPFASREVFASDAEALEAVYNYLVVVPDGATQTAMGDFAAWKESIGHRVVFAQLPSIVSSYSGIDDAERLRNFLIEKREEWAIHYVLLVGDMGTIPTRLLYMDDQTDAYASDFYFANLGTIDWDLDGDSRWGEFAADDYDHAYDVVVGRLPLNTAAEVRRYCSSVIAFERERAPWKQSAMFAAGFMDHDPTDGAELSERLIHDVLTPAGWSARKLYEQGGTLPSRYPSDADLTRANFAAECVAQRHSVVSLIAHGHWDFMQSKQCTDPDLNCDGNTAPNDFGHAADIATNCPPAVVNMVGCSTACPVSDYKHVETQPGGPPVSPELSLFPFSAQHEHNGVRYLRNGAVAATGASAGEDYELGWDDPTDGMAWSLAYYQHDLLIAHRKPVGDAFFEAMYTHAQRHSPLRRGVRDFYLMGDPSLIVEGVAPAAETTRDVLIHGGRTSQFSAGYDANGDVYVVVSAGASAEPAELFIYKSIDHGESWALWQHIEALPPIVTLEAIVNHSGSDEFRRDALLVFTTDLAGELRLHTFALAGGQHTTTVIATAGSVASHVSLSQDSLSPGSRLFLAYWCYLGTDPYSVIGVSTDNGMNWQHWERFAGYYFPAVDAGPDDHVHIAAVADDHRSNICVARSLDGGRTFGSWTNLTSADGASDHSGSSPPDITAASDPATPTVWVTYERRYDKSLGRGRTELGFASSRNGGATWQKDQTLSAGPGDNRWAHLAGFKAAPNPWVNCTYTSTNRGAFPAPAKVMHRAVSGEWPNRWRPALIRNHVNASDHRPRLIYSPGAPGTGGGVVFAGAGGLYFSAPWIAP